MWSLKSIPDKAYLPSHSLPLLPLPSYGACATRKTNEISPLLALLYGRDVKVIEIVFRLLESKNLLSLHLPSLENFFLASINLLRPSNPLPRVERTPLPLISC